MSLTNRKFQALDILRLWAAFEIALFHAKFSGLYHSNAYVFADFFFILSGFILAESHFSKTDFNPWLFIKARFVRLYPLHFLAMLALLVHFIFISKKIPEYADGTLYTFFSNIFLTHGLGFRKVSDGDWNFPTWAVAAEFWGNALFALLLFPLRKSIIGLIAIVAYVMLFTFDGTLNTFFHNYMGFLSSGLVRSVGGLGLGVVVHQLMKRNQEKSFWIWSLAEISVTVAIIFLLNTPAAKGLNHNDFLLVPLFAMLVGSFSQQQGVLSKVLTKLKLHIIGPTAYAIYILHWPLVLFIHEVIAPPADTRIFIYLPLLLIIGSLVHWYIEKPIIEKFKHEGISSRQVILLSSVGCLLVCLMFLLC